MTQGAAASTQALAADATTAAMVLRLRELVAQNARRLRGAIILEALGLALSALLAYLWLIFFLDTRLHLSLTGRVLGSIGLVAGLAWAGGLLRRRWRRLRLNEDEVALAVERRTPGGVQNRLINAVQLARTSAGPSMTDAVVAENYTGLQQLHLEQAAALKPALVRVGVASALAAMGLAFWALQPEQFANAAVRILLPLADIAPLYRTTLAVEPGDVEAFGDVVVRVHIEGERPDHLTLLRSSDGKRSAEVIAVSAGAEPVNLTLHDVTRDTEYAVRGGDYMSPTYRITVPASASFARMRVAYHYPAYTGRADKLVDTTSGELEALRGTRASLTFVFDQAVERTALVVDRPGQREEVLPLTGTAREYVGAIVLDDIVGYRVETARAGRAARRSGLFAVRVQKDQEPRLELSGLERRMEVACDAVLPLTIAATDDYGLEHVGLFYRRAALSQPKSAGADEGWQPIVTWPGRRATSFRQAHELDLAALQLAEGDRVEIAPRATDTDPQRQGGWTTGPIFELAAGGEGVALQLQYEQILRSQQEIAALTANEQALLGKLVPWLRRLDGGDWRWDDSKNVDLLHAALKQVRSEQEELRQAAGRSARDMVAAAGNLRLGVGMLADTEMVRVERILDSVPGRDQPQAKQAALADARLTVERTVRSLEEIAEQYIAFRADWELANMIPFTRMLAERQTKLRDQTKTQAGKTGGKSQEYQRLSVGRRQAKLLELCNLVQPAFTGAGARLKDQEPEVAAAFVSGAAVLGGAPLQRAMNEGGDAARAGRWLDAARHQTDAAEQLALVHATLRQAQADAAQKALAALKERAKSDLDAQKALEKLEAGSGQAGLKDYPDKLKLDETIRLRDTAAGKKGKGGDTRDDRDDELIGMKDLLSRIDLKQDSGVRQDTSTLTLAKEPGAASDLMNLSKERGRNQVGKAFAQEEYDDLVGKLLDETEDVSKAYQSLTLTTNQNNNDAGDVGKLGGTLSSVAAGAATGNQKPPSVNTGGMSRTGRQGARAFGMVAGDDGVNRRGRDQAQEGHEQAPDQAGKLRMHQSDDMQKDVSTGIGGKRVDSDDTHFSLADAGKWKDDMVKRLEKPQAKSYIVERQGERMDPKVAAQMRDLTSKQEQLIERLKAIKKELRNLYLPTEHLDELAARLQQNLESLKERPDAELFRTQLQTLDRLRGALRVYQGAGSSLQPSLPRERAVRGRALDAPPAPGLPGYEEAVKDYYLRLANQ